MVLSYFSDKQKIVDGNKLSMENKTRWILILYKTASSLFAGLSSNNNKKTASLSQKVMIPKQCGLTQTGFKFTCEMLV